MIQALEGKAMFKAEMVAPCGLDCNICSQALIPMNPCPNCGKAYSVHDRNCPHCGKRIQHKERENQ